MPHKYTQHSTEDKAELVGAIKAGKTPTVAGCLLGFDLSHACKIWRQYKETASIEDLPKSGWPPKLNRRARHDLVRFVRKNRRMPFTDLGNTTDPPISETTVHNYLQDAGYV